VAARTQPTNPNRRLLVFATAAVAVTGLGVPARASAHPGTLVHALDYEAQVTSSGRSRGIVSATSLDGDRKLALTVAPTATVLVLGYQGEPLLRFSPMGVEVNERSPSAITNKLAKRGSVPALDPHATPAWSSVSDGHRYAWHDHRLGPTPGKRYPNGNVASWTIPIVVDGRPDRISGRLLHVRGPPLWPWLGLLTAALAIAAVLVVLKSRQLIEAALFTLASVAGIAAVILSTSFAFVPGRSSFAAWMNVAFCCGMAVAVLSTFARKPSARHAIGGFVAVLAAFVGLSEANVFVHGFVISSLPAAVVRAATGIALSAGLIAAACAAALLVRDEPGRPTPARRKTHVQMAIPRGKPR
jgi:hypothetical protein